MRNPSLRSAATYKAFLLLLILPWSTPVGSRASDEAAGQEPIYSVGIKQVEFVDTQHGHRHIAMAVFYPATVNDQSSPKFVMPFFTNIKAYRDAQIEFAGSKHPLIMFSHGRGGNGLLYAWFAEFLAAHGYVVAAINHYQANSYYATIAYLANKLWQRPIDISLGITFLLNDKFWGGYIDGTKIGVAGHSQGGFTALWIGGAKVNRDKFEAFQRNWRNNRMVPEHLRRELPVDATPALDVLDKRVKAVFAMAPGVIQAFGFDEAGLKQITIPTYIIVGAGDTVTPPKDNAEFAAKNIPNAQLSVIPGPVGHNIFVNECDSDGKEEIPEPCLDDSSIDRGKIHELIGNAALSFFNSSLGVTERR
jgi:predicted dienelactone hydrolase